MSGKNGDRNVGGDRKVTYNADEALRRASGSDGKAISRQIEGMSYAEKQKALQSAMHSEKIDLSGESPIISDENGSAEDDAASPTVEGATDGGAEIKTPQPEVKPQGETPAEENQPAPETPAEASTTPSETPSGKPDEASELAKLRKQIADQDLFNRRVASENGELKKKLAEIDALPKNVEEMTEIEKKKYLDLIDDDKKFDQRLELKFKKMRETEKRQELEAQAKEAAKRQEVLEQTKVLVDQAMPDLSVVLDGMVAAAIESGATPQEAARIKSDPYGVAASMHPQAFRMLYTAGRMQSRISRGTQAAPRPAGEGRVNLGSLGKAAGRNGASTRTNGTFSPRQVQAMSHGDKLSLLSKRMREENIL
jgi:hypothetical protein